VGVMGGVGCGVGGRGGGCGGGCVSVSNEEQAISRVV
jgi:hypothetical protein